MLLPARDPGVSASLSPLKTYFWPFKEPQQCWILAWFSGYYFLAIIFWPFSAHPISSTRMLAEEPACPVIQERCRLLFWHPDELLAEMDVC